MSRVSVRHVSTLLCADMNLALNESGPNLYLYLSATSSFRPQRFKGGFFLGVIHVALLRGSRSSAAIRNPSVLLLGDNPTLGP